MLWILVNKVNSKMRITSSFHNEWKAGGGRNDKNVKVAANVKDDNTIQVDLIKEPTKNQVDQGGSCHQQTRECGRPNDDKNAECCDEELGDRFETQHALVRRACASDNGGIECCKSDTWWYSGLSYNRYNKASVRELF